MCKVCCLFFKVCWYFVITLKNKLMKFLINVSTFSNVPYFPNLYSFFNLFEKIIWKFNLINVLPDLFPPTFISFLLTCQSLHALLIGWFCARHKWCCFLCQIVSIRDKIDVIHNWTTSELCSSFSFYSLYSYQIFWTWGYNTCPSGVRWGRPQRSPLPPLRATWNPLPSLLHCSYLPQSSCLAVFLPSWWPISFLCFSVITHLHVVKYIAKYKSNKRKHDTCLCLASYAL